MAQCLLLIKNWGSIGRHCSIGFVVCDWHTAAGAFALAYKSKQPAKFTVVN